MRKSISIRWCSPFSLEYVTEWLMQSLSYYHLKATSFNPAEASRTTRPPKEMPYSISGGLLRFSRKADSIVKSALNTPTTPLKGKSPDIAAQWELPSMKSRQVLN